jgi:hypothetical protein
VSTTGSDNVFVGDNAGNDNTTGSRNVFIGSGSGNPSAATQVSNSVAIGANAAVSTSNTIVLGTNGQRTVIPGHFEAPLAGVKTFAGSVAGLLVENVVVRRLGNGDNILPSPVPVCWRTFNATGSEGGGALVRCTTSLSARPDQADSEPFSGGLELIQRLEPAVFTWKESGERDIGLSAEDVAAVEPLFTYANEQGQAEGVKYPNLSAVFINAIKQQQAQLSEQREQLRELHARLQRQQEQIAALVALAAERGPGGERR